MCTISVRSGNQSFRLNITFPELYPENDVPSFEITEESPVDPTTREKIEEVSSKPYIYSQSVEGNHCQLKLMTKF